MKYLKFFMTVFGAVLALNAGAANSKVEDWQNPDVNSRNRLPMHATMQTSSPDDVFYNLNGTWKFKYYESPVGRMKDFYKTSVNDCDWDNIPVPGIWEMLGYGDPIYVNQFYAWDSFYKNNPPFVPSDHNHVGQYRRNIRLGAVEKNRNLILHIGSATSNVRVWVNGKEVGYSEDSKLEAEFDITKFVREGDNLVALEIFRWCDGTYMECQDFWKLTGIARDTYIYSRPVQRIEDIRIVAGADGRFSLDTKATRGIKKVEYSISFNGKEVASFSAKPGKYSGKVDNVLNWSAETPNLYTLTARAIPGNETISLNFGFRDVCISGGQLLVNGKPVLIKGVNRHEIHPSKAYAISREDMEKDFLLMKQLKNNTIRTSHYPNDPYLYDLCDKYGMYVIDEANNESHGMGYGEKALASNPLYAWTILERGQRMVRRDFNRACIITWSLGNESGNGDNFIALYDWMKAEDSSRPVQYERAEQVGRNTDIICPMYAKPADIEHYATTGTPTKPLILCEYAHAMGNSNGNFKEYWDIIRKYPVLQGGCIWDFADQALYKEVDPDIWGTDYILAYGGDYNDFDASDSTFCCNGIVSPDRVPHPGAYEVRYQYQSIFTSPFDVENGVVEIYNENFFIDLSRYRMLWEIKDNGVSLVSGVVENLDVAPGDRVQVKLFDSVPANLAGEAYLNVRYELKAADGVLPAGSQVAYDQIKLHSMPELNLSNGSENKAFDFSYDFDPETGALCSYMIDGMEMLSEPLMPCFGRATTDNDLGIQIYDKSSVEWKYPSIKLVSFTREDNDNSEKVTAKYRVNDICDVEVVYNVIKTGRILVSESLTGLSAECYADLERFGMEFAMPGGFSTIDFFGCGPWETYSDRRSGAIADRYVQSVLDQYCFDYVRPQESGTHVGLRYFKVLDKSGFGLEFRPASFGEEISASALPFCRRDLEIQTYSNRHSLELKAIEHRNDRSNGNTYVNVDLRQMGVGGIESWAAKPLEQYRLQPGDYYFHFTIDPVVNY